MLLGYGGMTPTSKARERERLGPCASGHLNAEAIRVKGGHPEGLTAFRSSCGTGSEPRLGAAHTEVLRPHRRSKPVPEHGTT